MNLAKQLQPSHVTTSLLASILAILRHIPIEELDVKLQKFDADIESYDQAININPNYADA